MKRRLFVGGVGVVGGLLALLVVAVSLGLLRRRGPLDGMGKSHILLSGDTHGGTSSTILVGGEAVRVIRNDPVGDTPSLDYCTSFPGDDAAMRREASRVWSHFSSAVAGRGSTMAFVAPVDCRWHLVWSWPLEFATVSDIASPHVFEKNDGGFWQLAH